MAVMQDVVAPRVEVLYFDGCPSYSDLLPRLREIVEQAGGDPDNIRTRRIETPSAAVEERFLGSPTVRVDGHDIDPGAEHRTDYALTCRIYQSASGASRVPPENWLRDALRTPPRP